MRFLKTLYLLLCVSTVFAQAPEYHKNDDPASPKDGNITGKVIDSESGQVMEYANISIYKSSDSTLISGAITTSSGNFNLKKIRYGIYFIDADFIGFTKMRINNIRLAPGKKTIDLGTIKLQPSNQEIGTVNVVADRARVEYKVDKKVINVSQDINAAGGTAADVLENTPSVQVDIEGNVSLRGSSSFTVLIDGRPSVLAGNDALRQIPASAIENIEIITNPSVKYDPDGMAGIINLVMKKNILSGFNGVVNAMIGSSDKQKLDVTINHKNKKRNFSLQLSNSDYTYHGEMVSNRETHLNDTTQFLEMSGERNYKRSSPSIKSGVNLYLSENMTLGVAASIGKYTSERFGKGFAKNSTEPESNIKYTINDDFSKRASDFYSGNINFLQNFGGDKDHKLEGVFYYSHEETDDTEVENELFATPNFEPTGVYELRIRTTEIENEDEYRLKLDYSRPIGIDGKLEAGYQARIDRETEDYTFEDFDLTTQEWINNTDFSSVIDFKRDIHSIYSTYSNKAGAMQYMLGLRGEFTNRLINHTKSNSPFEINRFDLFPSGHVSYSLPNKDQLMTSYSRRIERPRGRDLDPIPNYMNQYTIRIGNPELEPEYTDSYEINYMKRLGRSFISIESFYRVTDNLITRINELGNDGILYMSSDNLNKSYSLGGELMGNLNLTDWFLLNSSFSVYNYKLKGSILDESVDKESTNYYGRFNTTFKFSTESRLQLTGMYRGPSVSAQGDYEGMFYSNISYRQDFFRKKLTATLSMQDIFGSGKREGTSYGSDFKSYFKFKREPRVVMFTVSYKINNFKMEKTDRSGGMMEMNMDGGEF